MSSLRSRPFGFSLGAALLAPWLLLGAAWGDDFDRNVDRYREIIDRRVTQRWELDQVTPAPRASDAKFFRRAWLDLAGTIPTAGATRAFLEDASPDKRRRATRELLDSSMYVERFAEQWLDLLVPEAQSNQQLVQVAEEMRSWLRQEAIKQTPYDEFVRSILSVPLERGRSGPLAYYSNRRDPRPTGFYAAKDTAPEDLAGATARVFLGIRMDCAQCHDHPFAHWTQDDFWQYAAFYQGLRRSQNQTIEQLRNWFLGRDGETTVSIVIPDTNRSVEGKFLGGGEPDYAGRTPRSVVTDWMVRADNPYFASAAVNRIWGRLLGRGLVDPVDDMGPDNPPSHPELLAELAERFSRDFDSRALIAGIVLSEPYQLASEQTHASQEYPEAFARFLPRRLDATQIRRSLDQALGMRKQPYAPGLRYNSTQMQFDRLFQSSAAPLQRTSSVQQALLLLNGQQVASQLSNSNGIIQAWAALPGVDDAGRIDVVCLSVLSRLPTDAERKRMLAHLASTNSEQGLADVCWALLNSAEFITVH